MPLRNTEMIVQYWIIDNRSYTKPMTAEQTEKEMHSKNDVTVEMYWRVVDAWTFEPLAGQVSSALNEAAVMAWHIGPTGARWDGQEWVPGEECLVCAQIVTQ